MTRTYLRKYKESGAEWKELDRSDWEYHVGCYFKRHEWDIEQIYQTPFALYKISIRD